MQAKASGYPFRMEASELQDLLEDEKGLRSEAIASVHTTATQAPHKASIPSLPGLLDCLPGEEVPRWREGLSLSQLSM